MGDSAGHWSTQRGPKYSVGPPSPDGDNELCLPCRIVQGKYYRQCQICGYIIVDKHNKIEKSGVFACKKQECVEEAEKITV